MDSPGEAAAAAAQPTRTHTLTHSLEGLNLWCGFLGGGLEP